MSKMATMSNEFAYLKSSQSNEDCSELYGRAFEESLVDDIQSYPCLWDASDSGYKDNRMKEKAFEVLGEKYGKTVGELRKMWKNFKENFSRCLRKRELMTRSGVPAVSLPECKLFHQLLFLRDNIVNRPTPNTVFELCTSRAITDRSILQPSSPSSVPCPGPSPPPSLELISSQPRKRKADKTTKIQKAIAIPEKEEPDNFMYEEWKQNTDNAEADQSFANSIVPILNALPAKKNRMAKIEIQQLLFKYEFEDEE